MAAAVAAILYSIVISPHAPSLPGCLFVPLIILLPLARRAIIIYVIFCVNREKIIINIIVYKRMRIQMN